MALTVSNAGSGSSASSSASLAFNSGATWSQYDLVVVCIAADNAGTNGVSSISSVTDAKGHTYSARSTILNDPGAASAGVVCAIYTAEVGSAGMASTDQITINFSPNTTCKLSYVYKVSGSTGTPTFASAEAGWTGRTNSVTATTASVTNGYALIMARGHEYNQTGTGDSDTTNGNWDTLRVAGVGGTFESGMSLRTQTKVVTADGTQAWTTAPGTSSDYAIAGIQINEVARVIQATGTATGTETNTASATATYTTLTASVTNTGSGTATAVLTQLATASATGTGDGTATASDAVDYPADGTATGTGDGSATAVLVQPATATGSGTGDATGEAILTQPSDGTGSGTGSGSATGVLEAVATATGAGTGDGSATATLEQLATGTATATGSAEATGTVEVICTAADTSSGSGTATGTLEAISTASATGTGTAEANATASYALTATATGTGDGSASTEPANRPRPAPYNRVFIPADVEVFPKRIRLKVTATADAYISLKVHTATASATATAKSKAKAQLDSFSTALTLIQPRAINTTLRHYSESRDLAEILLLMEDILL